MTVQNFGTYETGFHSNDIGNYLKLFGLIVLYILFPAALSSVSPILSSVVSMSVYYGMGIIMLISIHGEEIHAWRKRAQDELVEHEIESLAA